LSRARSRNLLRTKNVAAIHMDAVGGGDVTLLTMRITGTRRASPKRFTTMSGCLS